MDTQWMTAGNCRDRCPSVFFPETLPGSKPPGGSASTVPSRVRVCSTRCATGSFTASGVGSRNVSEPGSLVDGGRRRPGPLRARRSRGDGGAPAGRVTPHPSSRRQGYAPPPARTGLDKGSEGSTHRAVDGKKTNEPVLTESRNGEGTI